MEEFKGALMQSEWLVDIPENFGDWLVKVCPVGRRRLLHAAFGETCLYNGRGQRTHKYAISVQSAKYILGPFLVFQEDSTALPTAKHFQMELFAPKLGLFMVS